MTKKQTRQMQKSLLLSPVAGSWPLISNWPRAYHTPNHLSLRMLISNASANFAQNFYRWRPPAYIRDRTEEQHQKLREKFHIICEGEDIPPPIEHFQDMKIPKPILDFLKANRIITPTPIQLQGIPTAYASYNKDIRCEADNSLQFLRSRYDWHSLYWIRENSRILPPSHHDGPRRGNQTTVCPRRRTGRGRPLSLS